ncbi:hypothetical protein BDV96DRAFT_649278 [Lophiotrema nucula]|uniref:Uncharacterized protein n=1 Tax=Lophiotrema nucula TaxID=690887 RepID=A0A6A5Z039_9PLEO|nr:hypothetical protein BDV96DRAFT_649278 [Lophiotrema nucula]
MFRFGNPAAFFFPGWEKPKPKTTTVAPYPWNAENVPTFDFTSLTDEDGVEEAEMSYLKPKSPIIFESLPPENGFILKQVSFEIREEYTLQVPAHHTEIENPYKEPPKRPNLRRGGPTNRPKAEPKYMLIVKRVDFELSEERVETPNIEHMEKMNRHHRHQATQD